MKFKDLVIPTPLNELISIGTAEGDREKFPITDDLAFILLAKTRNDPEYGIHIQMPDDFDPEIDRPYVWLYQFWVADRERRAIAKRKSDQWRADRNVLEANMKMVLPYVKKEWGLDGDFANSATFGLVGKKQMGKLRAIGVEKLYEKESELP